MNKGYLIYNSFEANRNSWFISELISEAKKIDIDLVLLIEEDLTPSIIDNKLSFIYKNEILDIKNIDFVLCRTNNYILSKQFELCGIKVYNNSNVSLIANDKYLSYMHISKLGIDTLNTYYIDKNHNKLNDYNIFPVMSKPLSDKGGNNVCLNENLVDLENNVSKIQDKIFIIQNVPESIGRDIRVYVLNNKIYIAIMRIAKNGFKSNFCLGNDAVIFDLKKEHIDIVNKIIKQFDFTYVGIDFIYDDKNEKLYFNEIEDVVGSRMIYSLTDLNPARDLMRTIKGV